MYVCKVGTISLLPVVVTFGEPVKAPLGTNWIVRKKKEEKKNPAGQRVVLVRNKLQSSLKILLYSLTKMQYLE